MKKSLFVFATVVTLGMSGTAGAALVTFEGSTTSGANRELDVAVADFHGPSLINYAGYNWTGMMVAKPLVSVRMPQRITSVTNEWDPDAGDDGKFVDKYTTESVAAGFHRSTVSGDTVAFTKSFSGSSLYASMSALDGAENFNFYSTYMTAGWRDNINVNIMGLRDGATVYNQDFVIGDDSSALYNLNFLNIDKIEFRTSGGDFLYANGTVVGSYLNPSNAHSTPVLVFDNMNVAPVPVPAAAWLLGSGLIGLFGMSKKKKLAVA